ncbi:acylphosphatase [Salinicoccus halitifaciens]|uniref:acylphosphatase n=1 Tax=Salinicoccus halitifaciens TaxID=1073415 RepID=A0ABV2EBZ5_9STAP|nr:acylphosphatase [Salinicoccus halitifaciens]MCD2137391.1 acylphosphatase [Salinicoccus halitifaciens]
MSETEFRWMPHHEGAVPPAGQGKRISTYTVALEGWRRGLNLKYYSHFDEKNLLKVRYSLSDGTKTHHFQLSMGDGVTQEAFDICDNKETTKKYLRNADVPVPVPTGKMFNENSTDEEILAFAETMEFPIVLKPTDGNAGNGVFANIQTMEELKDIIPHVREELGFKEVIVEDYIPGREFRVVVIGDRVLGAMIRRPASVLGDGKHTIKELIAQTNEIRMTNPHLTSRLIKVDREIRTMLKRKGYKLNTIPDEGERVYLREKSNLSKGGDAIDVTDKLTENLKAIARNVGPAIPGLEHYGVDMIVDEENDTGVILEVNARPGFGGHLFPMEGTPRDFAKEIIDYYFPKTKGKGRSWLYFDFDSALEPIRNRTASSVEITTISPKKLRGKKFILSGKVIVPGYRGWIKQQAKYRNLNGYVENKEDGTVEVLAAGTDPLVLEGFVNKCFKGPKDKDVEVTAIHEENWDKPVKLGFDIINRKTDLTPLELEKEIEKLKTDNEKLEMKNQYLIDRHNRFKARKTWKMTAPLRFAYKLISRKK